MANALSQMPNPTKESGILDQTTDTMLFLLQLVWM
jgi:hypothetical protein